MWDDVGTAFVAYDEARAVCVVEADVASLSVDGGGRSYGRFLDDGYVGGDLV